MRKLTADTNAIAQYLKENGWLSANETVLYIEKPGEGNMNFTLRVATTKRSFIVKQSREYVEKYPQLAAPKDRVVKETEFYALVETIPELAAMMPGLIGLDAANSIMLMDDLGKGNDYTYLYRIGALMPENELLALMEFAAKLHLGIRSNTTSKIIYNREMRALNHEHIFRYPFLQDNGLDLEMVLPGLKAAAQPFKNDVLLAQRASELGELYLADGPSLLHGDYFPGSWLRTAHGVKVIDPEFCFFGPPEFEIGVTIAHLKMADQPETLISKGLAHYTALAPLEDTLRQKFTAIELLRRMLGLAQLPLEMDLEKRLALLDEARTVLTQ
ncbi:phosphotransferase [Arenibacter sp. GZD96]|uniref:phosphotransferase n=1 Tax=Aurantibrevibacter litoralis TaxID=3106030 RepID=UPI002AFF8A1E|nr:phosphotransferase [Arenibacter sp. GZD-96]MEA1786426.1 phosphotransferase [Arenibacter sp. GZD-96]